MKTGKKKVLMVGSAEESNGGVSSALRLMKRMPFWQEHSCYWLGTQIQRSNAWKCWYALKSYLVALFILWRYDVVHFHMVPQTMNMLVQMPILLLAMLGRKEVVMHVHVGNQLAFHVGNRLFRWELRHADRVVFLARRWEKLFLDKFPGVNDRTSVVYNPCDPDIAFDMSHKEKVILMACYFYDVKAPDLLLKAWQTLKDEYPDWRVMLVGNGDAEPYRQLAADLGLGDTVTIGDYVTGEEKRRLFSRASIYTMCSYWEGFPMVVLEAWKYGICVVSTPVGGLPEVTVEGRNLCTFGYGDWRQLAQRLRSLMDDEDKRREMAEFSRQFVDREFSFRRINAQMEEVYGKLGD